MTLENWISTTQNGVKLSKSPRLLKYEALGPIKINYRYYVGRALM